MQSIQKHCEVCLCKQKIPLWCVKAVASFAKLSSCLESCLQLSLCARRDDSLDWCPSGRAVHTGCFWRSFTSFSTAILTLQGETLCPYCHLLNILHSSLSYLRPELIAKWWANFHISLISATLILKLLLLLVNKQD